MIRDQPKTEDVSNALNCIDPDISYSDWLRIGMALHSWDGDKGLELWDAWSRKGSKYEFGDTEDRWNNFNSGGGITIKTLFSMAMENGYDPSEEHEANEEKMPIQYDPTELPCIALRNRFISAEVCKIYDVHTSVSEENGKTLDKSYFPYKKNGVITGWHVRNHQPTNKKDRIKPDIGVGSGKLDFFGQDTAKRNNGKKLFITEGRIDCLSLYETIVECTQEKWKHLKPSVVSVNNGAGSALKDCLNNRDFINRFDEVVLVFDPDEEGEKAVKKVLKSFPKFKVANLPNGFDVNDMRKEERDKELFDIVMWKSENIRQGSIVTIDEDFIKRAMEPIEFGISSPWPSWDQKIFGIQPARIHIVAAAPKIGKSEFKNQLAAHMTFHHKLPCGIYDMEENPEDSICNILSKHHGVDYLDPRVNYDKARLAEGMREISSIGTEFYDRDGSRNWDDVIVSMEEQYHLKGIYHFLIDPLMVFTAGNDPSVINSQLDKILKEAADFVQKYKTVIFFFCHVNKKPKGQKLHERGGRVYSNELSGSKAMEQWSHYGWGLSRDRTDECPPEDEDFTEFYPLFSRKKMSKGKLNRLYYDHETTRYLEV